MNVYQGESVIHMQNSLHSVQPDHSHITPSVPQLEAGFTQPLPPAWNQHSPDAQSGSELALPHLSLYHIYLTVWKPQKGLLAPYPWKWCEMTKNNLLVLAIFMRKIACLWLWLCKDFYSWIPTQNFAIFPPQEDRARKLKEKTNG